MVYEVEHQERIDHQLEHQPRNNEDRSLSELFGDLTREVGTLVHDEVSLARAELTEKAKRVGKNAGFLAAGGALAYAGLLALVAAAVLGITAAGLPGWASALIVGVVVAGIGGMLVMKGMAGIKEVDPMPRETVRTLKEDEEWAKTQIK
jgi:hypothetical protein